MHRRPPSPTLSARPLVVGLFALALGCAPAPEAELLELARVHPVRIEPGRTLSLEGAGFPPGRGCRVRLEGTYHRPGEEPRPVRVELTGRATSAEHADAPFTEAALEAFGGRGTLRGRISILFTTADREGLVAGRTRATLDVQPPSTRSIADALDRQRRAAALASELGLVLGDEPPGEQGLPIEGLDEGSVAARAGLIAGDRVVEAHGVMVHGLADVLPPPGLEQLELRVERRGESAPFAVALPVEPAHRGMSRETVRALQIGLAWVLLVLLWLAPTARVADWLGGRLRRRARRAATATSRVGFIRRVWRRHGRALAIPMLAVTAFAALAAIDRWVPLTAPLEAIVLGVLALRVSGAWLAGAPGSSGRRRAIELGHATAGAAAIAVAFGALAALGGTTDLAALHAQQGAAPWTWALLETPLGPLALGLVLVGGSTQPAPIARGVGPGPRAARTLDDLVLAAVAAATTLVLLGGWGADVEGTFDRAARALSFVVLASALFLWMRRARSASSPTLGGVLASVGLALSVIGGTAAHVALDPPAELDAALAQVVGGALVLLLVTVLARLAAGRIDPTPEPMQPFL